MSVSALPLKEVSIADLFFSAERQAFEVPIYQRNYAWGMDEITALVQDVYDAFKAGKPTYFIGTLVTFHKGKRIYEVIDGQQRLTTIYLVLRSLGELPRNELTYRSRKKSTDTIVGLGAADFGGAARVDDGIASGFESARKAIEDIVSESERHRYAEFFKERVHIIFYQVPKDIDLNHYFEVMNSRGEQLEQHEVVKAMLLGKLDDAGDRAKFNQIWERCSQMDGYIQQKFPGNAASAIFGPSRNGFEVGSFDELPAVDSVDAGTNSINELKDAPPESSASSSGVRAGARFQPIIDFPNFLLIVLKLTRMGDAGFDPASFTLDDKELLKQFDTALGANAKLGRTDTRFVKEFGYNLLLSKFFLDNYIVHHALDEERPGDNPWKLQRWEWHASESGDKGYPTNLFGADDDGSQAKCVHLLSMFEVSFTARQRKNYLLYCMLYLHAHRDDPRKGYLLFLSDLARTYLRDVYLGPAEGLNDKNTPKPGSFDAAVLERVEAPSGAVFQMRDLRSTAEGCKGLDREEVLARLGDGRTATRGIPLFVFNYIDYLLWAKYFDDVRGSAENAASRKAFFESLVCGDFGLDAFKDFYFSRTRRSLEHYYSQALQARKVSCGGPTVAQINCLGNFAMIGHDMNSSGSDWSPKVKLDHYLDPSGKVSRVSVASLKFLIMMQACKDNEGTRAAGEEWVYDDIERHQAAMVKVLLGEA